MSAIAHESPRRLPVKDGQSGESLVGTLVALAIFGIIILLLTSFIGGLLRAMRVNQQLTSIAGIRDQIALSMSCVNTLTPMPQPACTDPGASDPYIPILRPNNSILVAKYDPSHQGMTAFAADYYLRARCAPCPICSGGMKILVEISRRDGNHHPVTDLETGRPFDWRDLYDGIPIACRVR